jgi:bifunctional non-homologous end joining protein LigD
VPVAFSVAPQLCSPRDKPPAGNEWLHEIKLDGYRMLAHFDGARVRMISRNGLEWTRRFGSIVRALAALGLRDTIVDGEAVIFDQDRRIKGLGSSFPGRSTDVHQADERPCSAT